jgi:hypothetical protein
MESPTAALTASTYGAAQDSLTIRAAYAAIMNALARESINARTRTVKASR